MYLEVRVLGSLLILQTRSTVDGRLPTPFLCQCFSAHLKIIGGIVICLFFFRYTGQLSDSNISFRHQEKK